MYILLHGHSQSSCNESCVSFNPSKWRSNEQTAEMNFRGLLFAILITSQKFISLLVHLTKKLSARGANWKGNASALPPAIVPFAAFSLDANAGADE